MAHVPWHVVPLWQRWSVARKKQIEVREQPQRADWDSYFMQIAQVVASRSTCDRKHVGALLVRDRMILSTGYNGSIRGMAHCDDVGNMLENGHCVATIQAEYNAVLQEARNGMRIEAA